MYEELCEQTFKLYLLNRLYFRYKIYKYHFLIIYWGSFLSIYLSDDRIRIFR